MDGEVEIAYKIFLGIPQWINPLDIFYFRRTEKNKIIGMGVVMSQ
jgi:hypothetical protein